MEGEHQRLGDPAQLQSSRGAPILAAGGRVDCTGFIQGSQQEQAVILAPRIFSVPGLLLQSWRVDILSSILEMLVLRHLLHAHPTGTRHLKARAGLLTQDTRHCHCLDSTYSV